MHEWGTHFRPDLGAPDKLRTVMDIEWVPEYRDEPVVNDYVDNPLQLRAGDRIDTYCTFFNDSPEMLEPACRRAKALLASEGAGE